MSDIYLLLTLLAGGYVAALLGVIIASSLRLWGERGERLPTSREAASRVLLPPCAFLLFLIIALGLPHDSGLLPPKMHLLLHRWATQIQANDSFHAALHLLNGTFILILLTLCIRTAFAMGQLAGSLRALTQSHRICTIHGVRVCLLPTDTIVCFTAGLFRPNIYTTERTLTTLTETDTRAMLAHETAHVQRGDTLFATVVSLFATLVPLPGYIALMRDWEVAAEHTCDRIAAERVGDAYAVASALVTVAHLLATEPPPSSPAIVAFSSQRKEGGVQKRVQALLLTTQGGRDERGRMQMLIAFWGVGLLASILLTPYLCHVMELLFLH